jgi:hypothetical protein
VETVLLDEISGSHSGEYKDVLWDVAPVVWYKFADVSEVLTASIIGALMMKVICVVRREGTLTKFDNPSSSIVYKYQS